MARDAYHSLTTTPEPGRPLVFAFHGTGGDESQFFELAQSLVPGGGVVSPRGNVSEHGAARFFRRRAEGIYDMEDLAARTKTMAAFVAAHKEAHPGSPAYGFGYSNGANILASVAMAGSGLFDRIALLHPLIPWAPAPVPGLAKTPVLVTAGARDPIAPADETARLLTWFEAQGAAVEQLIHPGGHELRPEEVTALATFLSR